jgi:transposase InsO family protein
MLSKNGISVSMTESGDPKENAMAERINSTIKNELFKGMTFTSIAEVKKAVRMAVDFYNNQRPHMSINMMTPKQAAECEGEIKKVWNSRREQAIKQARI